MTRLLHLLFSILLLCFSLTINAQAELPYYSGFDNTSERAGWQIYRLGENALADWSIATVGGFSPTSCISHDYAPSTGAVLADDWYVSPGFEIPAGGTLDSVRYAFSGFSVPADDDSIGVYLLTGSQNPTDASSITLLKDFRGGDYITDATYRLLSGVSLPPSSETSYIAIRYRNAQVSSRWLHVRFDNVAVSGLTTSVHPESPILITRVFPNPSTDWVSIQHHDAGGTITIYDQLGRVIYDERITSGATETRIPLSTYSVGCYYIQLQFQNQKETVILLKK